MLHAPCGSHDSKYYQVYPLEIYVRRDKKACNTLPIKNTIIFFFIICNFLSLVFAQSQEKNSFRVHLDYARFRAEQNLSFVEIFYAFDRDTILHKIDGQFFKASYRTTIEISANDSLLKTIRLHGTDSVDSLSQIHADQMINDVYGLVLGAGKFKINVTVSDLGSGRQGSSQIEFNILPVGSTKLTLSDIQLALNIKRSQQQNRFIKNGLQIIPNPSAIYNLNWPVLYYYFEIYNLQNPNVKPDAQYTISGEIKDIGGEIMKTIAAKSKKISSKAVVEVDKTLVSALSSGVYRLHLEIINEATQEKADVIKQFYVYRVADFARAEEGGNLNKDELYLLFLTKTEEEIDREFEFTTYITTSDEEDIYEELNLAGKRTFMTGLWGVKNTSPGKKPLIFRQEYMERVQIANDRYSVAGKPGWRTARGRILLRYGIPDDAEKYYGGPAAKQYETWTYHSFEGGVEFVFVDVSGYGNYRLVHSTAKEEMYDPNWQQKYLQ
jgi:GWxTD domain-containing protein